MQQLVAKRFEIRRSAMAIVPFSAAIIKSVFGQYARRKHIGDRMDDRSGRNVIDMPERIEMKGMPVVQERADRKLLHDREPRPGPERLNNRQFHEMFPL